ncbi:ABC transporter ATP-binding protein [Bifidobacterium stellenboschense]|uniref:Peptide ABC transporter ATP-binding protein n=1 Tax=Bifidobacterium stellenboschense TaxID=762211 RepID=A0A087DUA1_9BIFI|nr:ABC transporter ATP-binding protein [Bifidobacterium stellenboschense]KFI99101.1 peptide ABC transporter ATP-binding protein [Bifidobacterium stellenboschense]
MAVDIHDLHVALGAREIVHGVDLHIGDGERVGLIGSSGSGKSMIAKSLLGLLPREAALSGAITMGDAAILTSGGAASVYADERTLADLRGRYVGVMFQNPTRALNPVMTVAQIIGLPLYLHYDLTLAERVDRIKAMLDKVGLPQDALLKRPHELSGGQRQRVGIAAALVTSPRLIIADEPTTALDSITQRQIVDLLVSLVDDAGASMLFITHDFAVLQRATTRCYVLDAGRIVESGSTADLLDAPGAAPTRELVAAARALTLRSDASGRISGGGELAAQPTEGVQR